MKKTSKSITLIIVALLVAGLLCSCGNSAKDIPVQEISDTVSNAIGNSGMTDPGENYVKGYMKKSASEIGEYIILKNVMGTNIDEFGIFKSGTMTVNEIKTMLEGYLKTLRDSWMNYQPEEEPKLTGAEIRVIGEYVMYCILDEADRTTAFKAFSDALK